MPRTQGSLSISLSKITRDSQVCQYTVWVNFLFRMTANASPAPCNSLLLFKAHLGFICFQAFLRCSGSIFRAVLDPPSVLSAPNPPKCYFLTSPRMADAFLWPLYECVKMCLWLCFKGCFYGYLKYQIYWKFPRGTHMPDFILDSHGNHASNKYSLWLSVTSVDGASLSFTYIYKLCI